MEMEKLKRRSNGAVTAAAKKQRLRPAATDDPATAAQAMAAAAKSRIEPNIIYAVSPRLYHADPSNFSSIVQILTGCAETRSRCKDMAILEDILDEDAKSQPSCSTADSPCCSSSPCSSISSSTTSAATVAAASASPLQGIEVSERDSDHSGSIAETMADDEVNWREMLQEISSPLTSWSSGSSLLQVDRFFGRVSAEQHACFVDATMDLQTANHRSSAPCCWHAQGTAATFMEMCFKDDWVSVCVQDDYSSNSSISGYDSLSL